MIPNYLWIYLSIHLSQVGLLVVEHGDNAAQRAAVLSVLHGRHGFVRVRSVVHK